MANENGKTVQATQTSLDIIEKIQKRDGATMAELKEQLDLARSTVFNHLNTLRQNGYVTKRGEVYHLDFKFLFLGEYTKRRNDVYKLAEKQVKEMASECDQYVDFCVEQNGRVLTVHLAVDGIQNPTFRVAEYYHMTTTAHGKAILAHLSDERVEEIIEQWGLPRRTENTITSRDKLLDELKTIHKQGYAVSYQECIEGLRAVAVPVVAPDGTVLGAFGISGPTYEMTDEVIESDFADLLIDAKRKFQEKSRDIYISMYSE